MCGSPAYRSIQQVVVLIGQYLEALEAAAAGQALAVAHLLDDLEARADALVAAGAVGEEADLDVGVATAVDLLLIQHLIAGPVDDAGTAVLGGVGVQEKQPR